MTDEGKLMSPQKIPYHSINELANYLPNPGESQVRISRQGQKFGEVFGANHLVKEFHG